MGSTSLRAFIAFVVVTYAHARAALSESSICKFTCDDTAGWFNQGTVNVGDKFTMRMSAQLHAGDPAPPATKVQVDAMIDSACSIVLARDNYLMKFVINQHGMVDSVCSMQDAVNVDVENDLKAIASMLQVNAFFGDSSVLSGSMPSFVNDITGSCIVSYDFVNSVNAERTKKYSDCLLPQADGDKTHTLQYFKQTCVEETDKARIECTDTFDGDNVDFKQVTRLTWRKSQSTQIRLDDASGGRLTTLAMTDESNGQSLNVREALENACRLDTTQPQRFMNLVNAARKSQFSELYALNQVIDGVCQAENGLDGKRLFHDALKACRSESCVEMGVNLIMTGQVELAEANSWLVNFATALFDNTFASARTVELIGNVIQKFYDNEKFYNSNVLALGAVIGSLCDSNKKCDEYGAVQDALKLMQRPLKEYLSASYSDERKQRLIASLKAIANAGVGPIDMINKMIQAGDNEISAAAVRSLHKFSCDESRFDALATFLSEPRLELLESYQYAYVEMWHCPSIEAQQLAEWIHANTEWNVVRTLVYTHAVTVSQSSNAKYFEAKSLLSGIVSAGEMSELFQLQNSQFAVFGAPYLGHVSAMKVMQPGSFIPRSIDLDIDVMDHARVLGLRVRSENLENSVLNALYSEEETLLSNDPAEQAVTMKLGKAGLPHVTFDVKVGDNEMYTFNNDHVDDLVQQIKSEIDEIKSMSTYEKLKAMFGYSNAGFLKYLNGEPVDYQREINLNDETFVIVTSNGSKMLVNTAVVGLSKVRAVGSLSALGFNGRLEPQFSMQHLVTLNTGTTTITCQSQITANLNSALSMTYTQSNGVLEVQVEKDGEEHEFLSIGRKILINGIDSTPENYYSEDDIYYSPTLDVQFKERSSDQFTTITYRHTHDHPLIFRTQYDATNGILIAGSIQPSETKKTELHVNYRESDQHMLAWLAMDSTEMKIEGRITPKKFVGEIVNKNFFPMYERIDLVIEDKATDEETAQQIYKPSLNLNIEGTSYMINNEIHVLADRVNHDIEINAGPLGTYYIIQQVGSSAPQVSVEVHIGQKPDPDFPADPSYSGIVSLKQVQTVKNAGFQFKTMLAMGREKYGLESSILVSTNQARILFKTEGLIPYLMGDSSMDDISFDGAAKWAINRSKSKYDFMISSMVIPGVVETTKKLKMRIERVNQSKERTSATNLKLELPSVLIFEEKTTLKIGAKVQIAFDYSSAKFSVEIIDAIIPQLGSFVNLNGLTLSADYDLSVNQANAHLLGKLGEMQLVSASSEYSRKGDLRQLTMKLVSPMANWDFGFDGELEIKDQFDLRIFVVPSMDGTHYPALIKYADQSANSKLDLALQVSLTGVMPGMGQGDTLTFTLGLLEEPRFVYTVKGHMLGEDLMHQQGAQEEMYSTTLTIANGESKRGFSFAASNESNEMFAAECMVDEEENDTYVTVRGRVQQEYLGIKHHSHKENDAAGWSHTGKTTVDNQLTMYQDLGTNFVLSHNVKSNAKTFHGTFKYSPGEGYSLDAVVNMNYVKQMCDAKLTQNLMPDQGFDQIAFKAQYIPKGEMLKYMIGRNGKEGRAKGQIKLLENGLKNQFQLADKLLNQFMPTQATSSLEWSTEIEYGFVFAHKHSGGQAAKVDIATQLMASSKMLTFSNKVNRDSSVMEQVFDARIGDFSNMTPTQFQFTNKKSNGSNQEFRVEVKSDSANNFVLAQKLEIDGRGEEVKIQYKGAGTEYVFSVDIKQSFKKNFPDHLKLSETIHGKGSSGLQATTLLEMWSNGDKEDCKVLIEATPNADNANFRVTWTTTLKFVKNYMKTLEHMVAEGKASWRLPSPSAEFSLKAVTTNESADIKFTSVLNSFFDFQMKLAADQYFNAFPLNNVYAAELINDYFASSQTKVSTQLILTIDDPYTPEVEEFNTEFLTVFGVQTAEYPSFLAFMNNVPPKMSSTLIIPEYVFGDTLFNLLQFGYSLDIEGKICALSMLIDEKTADFSLGISETNRGGYNIAINYAHAKFGGSLGTYRLDQSIDLLDNGFRVSEYGFSIPILAITNNVIFKCPGLDIDIKPKVDFKLENTDRLFTIDLKWKQDTKDTEKQFSISFKSSDSTADLNVALYERLMNGSDLPSPIIGLFAIAKTATDPFGIGIIHGVVHSVTSGAAKRSRQKFGGEFELALLNYFEDDVLMTVANVYEPKEQNFKFSSLINIICEECDAPQTDHDLSIAFNNKIGEVDFRWNLDIDEHIVLDSQFRVQAGVTSFRIRGDPLFEMILTQPIDDITRVKIELDFDARNSDAEFSMTLNKIDVSVNREQYHFGLSKGLLRIVHGERFQLVSSMTHNIDALSENMILERSELNTDLKITDPATSSFEASLTLRGASRKSNELQVLHDISAQGQLQVMQGQSWVRTGVVMVKANSPIMPRQTRIKVNRIGLEEVMLMVYQAVADVDIVADGEKITLLFEQTLSGNYRTNLNGNYKNDLIVKVINDWMKTGIKSEFDITYDNDNYRSNLDCSWSKTKGMYTFDGLYTHNLLEITRLASLPSKVIMTGRLSETYDTFQFTTDIGSYGASVVSYDFDFSDNLGHMEINIPGATRQLLKIKASTKSPGYSLMSKSTGHVVQASGFLKCENDLTSVGKNSCKVKLQNIYKRGRSTKKINISGSVDYVTALNGNVNVQTKVIFDVLGNRAKLSNNVQYRAQTGGAFDLTWNMDTLPIGKFVQLGLKTNFATPAKPARSGQFKFNFDDMAPIDIQYSDVFTRDTTTIGMRASIGAVMGLLEDYLGSTAFDLNLLPRNWLEWEVNIDRLASKYGVRVAPDHHNYRGDVSFNREGVNLIFSQPHRLRFVPTTLSAHCDLIQQNSQVSCNVKATVDNIQRELHFSAMKSTDMFEFEAKIKPDPMSSPATAMLRVTQNMPAVTVFAHISCDAFNFNSNNQFNAKRNRYTFQTTNQLHRLGITDNYNVGIEFNNLTKVLIITSLMPGMDQEEQIEIPLKEASTAIRRLFQDSGLSTNIGRLVPRIGREQSDTELVFYVGFGRSSNEYADLTLKIYKGFHKADATEHKKASVFCGLALGARNEQPSGISKKIDLVGVHLKIVDQSYVQAKFAIDDGVIKFTKFDLNQFGDDVHSGIDEYSQIFKVFVESMMRTAKISENSQMFAYYASATEQLSYEKVNQMTDSLHAMVNYLMFELRSINPAAATTHDTYTPRDMIEGIVGLGDLDLLGDFGSPLEMLGADFGLGPDNEWIDDEYLKSVYDSLTQSYMSDVVSCLNDVECIITLPIPLSAQDPEHFNIKKAIIESPIVQAIFKFMDLNETMNVWYRVRAALAKPATPWYSATATIANGKHFTTFDGQTYSLKGIAI